ncbi:homeobox-containing protein 1-like [Callorhinchus milii]|uniref:homeobox-containing protein 1-like n=1 Tax=Callorhinchus milii TaxID=7868 RepID=UPI001C3FCCCA|nr:homeobox-containing protein 1-like [Callorhinchus milii]
MASSGLAGAVRCHLMEYLVCFSSLSYFHENQYPDEAKREEISNACNAVVQKPGKKLTETERVTPLKVYNWFANRRKEIKKRANIEAAILETHGIDVQSPGAHSNSDDIDGSDFWSRAVTPAGAWCQGLYQPGGTSPK